MPERRYMFECPFCGKFLGQTEMQFHVGIPLCMEQRKLDAKTLPHDPEGPLGGSYIKYQYFGKAGLKKLIRAVLSHMPGDPPLHLPSFVDHSEDNRRTFKVTDIVKKKTYDICENCRHEVSICTCMDGPEDSAYDKLRHGDYDYCGDDMDYNPCEECHIEDPNICGPCHDGDKGVYDLAGHHCEECGEDLAVCDCIPRCPRCDNRMLETAKDDWHCVNCNATGHFDDPFGDD